MLACVMAASVLFSFESSCLKECLMSVLYLCVCVCGGGGDITSITYTILCCQSWPRSQTAWKSKQNSLMEKKKVAEMSSSALVTCNNWLLLCFVFEWVNSK